MSEKLHSTGEQEKVNAEALEAVGAERQAELEKNLERNVENLGENDLEGARHEALELATSQEDEKKATEKESQEKPQPEKPVKHDLDDSFRKTMQHIQKDMSPASRTLSKVIHNPIVEKTSEVIGNTVARPNLILAGAIGMITLGLGIYLIAKSYGYVLSGFEMIGASIIGWGVGAIIEFIRVGLKGNQL